MDTYTLIIILTTIGFLLLAALLLTPVYFFLNREEERGERWTEQALSKRIREETPRQNGDEKAQRPPPKQES